MNEIVVSNEKNKAFKSNQENLPTKRICQLLNKGVIKLSDNIAIHIEKSSTFLDERLIHKTIKTYSSQSVTVYFEGGIEGTKPQFIKINGGKNKKFFFVGDQGIAGVNFNINRPLRKKVYNALLEHFPKLKYANFDEVAHILKTIKARDIALTYGNPSVNIEEQNVCPNCQSDNYTDLKSGEGNTISGFLECTHSVYRHCNNCSLVFLGFQVPKESLNIFYSNDTYYRHFSTKKILKHWEDLNELTTSHYGNYERGLEVILDDDIIIDLGSGSGDFIALVKQRKTGTKIYSVDWHLPDDLKKALLQIGVSAIEAPLDSNLTNHFRENMADIITLWEVIEHLKVPDLKLLLKSIHRILKPNGCLIISTPDFYDDHCRSLDFWSMAAGEHLSVFNLNCLKEILIDCGFNVERFERESVTVKVNNQWYAYGFKTNQTIAGRASAGIIESALKNPKIRGELKKQFRNQKIGSELILFARKI